MGRRILGQGRGKEWLSNIFRNVWDMQQMAYLQTETNLQSLNVKITKKKNKTNILLMTIKSWKYEYRFHDEILQTALYQEETVSSDT